jgi:transcriptional regulator with XRE-family HTH domain
MSDTTMAPLPEQTELRSRLRAARTLRQVSLKELADQLDPSWKLSERTLRKLESGESEITERALRPIAAALDVPFGWFVTEDPLGPWRGTENAELAAEFERRLAALESQIRDLATPPSAPPRGRAARS